MVQNKIERRAWARRAAVLDAELVKLRTAMTFRFDEQSQNVLQLDRARRSLDLEEMELAITSAKQHLGLLPPSPRPPLSPEVIAWSERAPIRPPLDPPRTQKPHPRPQPGPRRKPPQADLPLASRGMVRKCSSCGEHRAMGADDVCYDCKPR